MTFSYRKSNFPAPALSRQLESPYLLNAIQQTAACAFGLRQLREEYTGPCVRLQQSGGNTADIGFTSSGEFDIAAARAFIPSGGLAVAIWYDQSGSGKYVSQLNYSRMPGVTQTSGVLGGEYAMYLDGVDDHLLRVNPLATPLFSGQDQYTLNSVHRPTRSATQVVAEQNSQVQTSGARGAIIQVGNVQGFNGESNDAHIWACESNTDYLGVISVDNSITPNINGEFKVVNSAGTTGGRTTATLGNYGFYIGRKAYGSEYWQGYISEVIWFGFTMTQQERIALARRQGSYFGIQTR